MEFSPWKIVVGTGVVVSLVGGVYAIDKNYVRQNYHDVCFAQVNTQVAQANKDISAVQKQISTQRVYDEVYFWQKMEVELTKQQADHPTDQKIKIKLDEVQKKKEAAEKRLESLEK